MKSAGLFCDYFRRKFYLVNYLANVCINSSLAFQMFLKEAINRFLQEKEALFTGKVGFVRQSKLKEQSYPQVYPQACG